MKPQIYCEATGNGQHNFYLLANGQSYYLFQQAYRKGVHNHYCNGVRLDDACDYSKAKRDNAIMHTMEKLPAYIRYIEKEYEIVVLKQTQKRHHSVRQFERIPA